MHELKSTPKRYQNPEVFELLAMEYAVGSLQGKARQRFEVLMETHFYLRATVDAYESKFANLVELLPEKQPAKQVWNDIESHIKKSTTEKVSTAQKKKSPWWQMDFFKKSFSMAAMALIVSMVYFYDPMTDGDSAVVAYSAVMESSDDGSPIAFTKIKKSSMKLSIDIMKPMKVADGMELTLWCHPKYGGKPMKMGTISESGVTELTISQDEYNNLKSIGQLEVSVEKIGKTNISSPSNHVILKGQLTPDEDKS